ncbi:MAG: hypothetical protein HY721_06665 [Planctomycetes bacterium]|nr:hypothetical protein [Planctomycetota bacterium]
MPHGSCSPLEAPPSAFALTGDPGRPVRGLAALPPPLSGPAIVCGAPPGCSLRWSLLAPPGCAVRVNGLPLATGFRALLDGDEIRFGSSLALFTATEVPRVVPFPGGPLPVRCLRCRSVIASRSPALRCPGSGCGLWFHQSADLPCFTGPAERPFSTCASCVLPAALSPSFPWTPEEP